MLVSKSRRALLRGLAVAPVAASVVASPWGGTLAALHRRYDDEPAMMERTKEGRSISRFRYHNAERWMTTLAADFLTEPRFAQEALHRAGFVTQQALCAYLLDIGFSDAWNARHIKQDIAKALAYANACGFGHGCPDMTRLAVILSPYWKWGYHYDDWEEDRPRTGGFIPATITPLVRALVDRVHDVTGHPRPKGCQRRRQEAWS
ncbi:hypothetical protein CP98_00623 [Sphingobium yanoikuyae]|uniref:Uncharacterized protein n=1 Tax=Sphingobium yanoikuyae TaxID=13690 RepID=A0A084ET81_SPHYA|nr:hypothetical protein [Sphingobium yanoikuyae]KEZ21173.1 hypothetical protein CP98_00623 [Sphingobium yanoikuyae]